MRHPFRARNRRWLQGIALALAMPQGAVSFWALLAPRSFYDAFPAPGRAWIASLGPFDEHLIVDYGAASLGLVVITVVALARSQRTVTPAIACGWIAWTFPHLAFHAANSAALAPFDSVLNVAVLAVSAALSLALLVAVRVSPAESPPVGEGGRPSAHDPAASGQGSPR